jgi:hypothetical protein
MLYSKALRKQNSPRQNGTLDFIHTSSSDTQPKEWAFTHPQIRKESQRKPNCSQHHAGLVWIAVPGKQKYSVCGWRLGVKLISAPRKNLRVLKLRPREGHDPQKGRSAVEVKQNEYEDATRNMNWNNQEFMDNY